MMLRGEKRSEQMAGSSFFFYKDIVSLTSERSILWPSDLALVSAVGGARQGRQGKGIWKCFTPLCPSYYLPLANLIIFRLPMIIQVRPEFGLIGMR